MAAVCFMREIATAGSNDGAVASRASAGDHWDFRLPITLPMICNN